MPNNPEATPYWMMYRESLWAHLRVQPAEIPTPTRRVLFLRRPGSLTRRLLNHDEIAAVLQAHGFEVSSMTPDWHSLSVVASAVVQALLLIGIGSGVYNAIFLPSGRGALELVSHCSDMAFDGTLPWQVGFERLGVHVYVYACPHLYTRGFLGVGLDERRSIVVSPKTMLMLLRELVEILEQSRQSGSEAGSVTAQACLSWEANHSQSWTPY